MEIAGPKPLRHLATTYDYSPLDGAVDGRPKVKPMDGDGYLTDHSTGRVLFIENRQPGEEPINFGEIMTYQDLARLNPEKAIVVVVEHSGKLTDSGAFLFDPIRIWKIEPLIQELLWKPYDINRFREGVSSWFKNIT